MDIFYFITLGFGLAMDAAAVSMCKGLAVGKVRMRHCVIAGAYFGIFQGLMPAVGYALGSLFSAYIEQYTAWISFVLLLLIGANMLKESFEKEDDCCECQSASFTPRVMLPLAVATSIDAMATGVTLLNQAVWSMLVAVVIIAVITFAISAVSVWLGGRVGDRFGSWAERAGGCILILLGVYFLLQGLGVL